MDIFYALVINKHFVIALHGTKPNYISFVFEVELISMETVVVM
jgi:hypothetical protein